MYTYPMKHSRAVHIVPSDIHFKAIYEMVCWIAMYRNKHMWYNLRDMPLEFALTEAEAIEQLLSEYFEE